MNLRLTFAIALICTLAGVYIGRRSVKTEPALTTTTQSNEQVITKKITHRNKDGSSVTETIKTQNKHITANKKIVVPNNNKWIIGLLRTSDDGGWGISAMRQITPHWYIQGSVLSNNKHEFKETIGLAVEF